VCPRTCRGTVVHGPPRPESGHGLREVPARLSLGGLSPRPPTPLLSREDGEGNSPQKTNQPCWVRGMTRMVVWTEYSVNTTESISLATPRESVNTWLRFPVVRASAPDSRPGGRALRSPYSQFNLVISPRSGVATPPPARRKPRGIDACDSPYLVSNTRVDDAISGEVTA
jgi:hypothetical protein